MLGGTTVRGGNRTAPRPTVTGCPRHVRRRVHPAVIHGARMRGFLQLGALGDEADFDETWKDAAEAGRGGFLRLEAGVGAELVGGVPEALFQRRVVGIFPEGATQILFDYSRVPWPSRALHTVSPSMREILFETHPRPAGKGFRNLTFIGPPSCAIFPRDSFHRCDQP